MSDAATVLITGATGALGPAVIRAFNAEGWKIRTLSRNAPRPGTPAASCEHVRAEINDVAALRRGMAGVRAVVHMAALLHVFDDSAGLADYERVNVGGTAAVMAAARDASVQQVVALSSIAVYGSRAGATDEDTPPAPDTPYGVTKLRAEREVLDARTTDGKAFGCVLRLAAVYGPSVKGNYERLVRAVARGRFIPIGRGSNARTLVFEDDAAQAIVLGATKAAAIQRVFNVTDGRIHTVTEIVGTISRALDRPPPRVYVPASIASAGISAVESLFRLAGRRPPVTRRTLDKYLEHVTVSGDRITAALGYEPRWSLDAGWRCTVERMHEEGRL